jgi:hypothetical protein
LVKKDELQHWLQEQLPAQLLASAPEIAVYDDEVVVMLPLTAEAPGAESSNEDQRDAALRLIGQRREETRALRMRFARDLQEIFGRPVAWGMRAGETSVLFTTRTAPVMTRLGRAERNVLDTLVAAGVADTRSSALAYTVRAFATEHADWLAEVRAAIKQVDQVRARLKLTRRPGAPAAEPVDEAEETEDRG